MNLSIELVPLIPPVADRRGEGESGSFGARALPPPLSERVAAIRRAGFNTSLLASEELFLDMLSERTPSARTCGVGAASVAAPPPLQAAARALFGTEFVLPVRRGRSAERAICECFARPGAIVATNCRFATTRANVEAMGAALYELPSLAALDPGHFEPFKGDMDIQALETLAAAKASSLAFVRMEASANLLGGQPFSLANLREVSRIARSLEVPLVLDASLLEENVDMIREREPGMAGLFPAALYREIAELCDLLYISGRRPPDSRGGAILCSDRRFFDVLGSRLPALEECRDYDGICSDEIAAMVGALSAPGAVTEPSRRPSAVLTERLAAAGIPVALPVGAQGCHIDARSFLPHLEAGQYPAASLAAALYVATGARGMERGTLSAGRDGRGREAPAELELLRLAPAREGLSQTALRFLEDRLVWLQANAGIVGGLRFVVEPPVLRFLTGRLEAVGDWTQRLARALQQDYGGAA